MRQECSGNEKQRAVEGQERASKVEESAKEAQEEEGWGMCGWHERNNEWGKGRETLSEREREQTGSSEESVRWKRQSLALYLLILFPGHIPWGFLFKYLMNNVPLVHSVDFVFVRPSGSSMCHREDPSQAAPPIRLDSTLNNLKNMSSNLEANKVFASHERYILCHLSCSAQEKQT